MEWRREGEGKFERGKVVEGVMMMGPMCLVVHQALSPHVHSTLSKFS